MCVYVCVYVCMRVCMCSFRAFTASREEGSVGRGNFLMWGIEGCSLPLLASPLCLCFAPRDDQKGLAPYEWERLVGGSPFATNWSALMATGLLSPEATDMAGVVLQRRSRRLSCFACKGLSSQLRSQIYVRALKPPREREAEAHSSLDAHSHNRSSKPGSAIHRGNCVSNFMQRERPGGL